LETQEEREPKIAFSRVRLYSKLHARDAQPQRSAGVEDGKGEREMKVMISFAVLLLTFSVVFSQTSSNPARDVLSVDRDWASWSTNKGAEARTILNTILADDYCFIGPGGSVLTKSEYLNQIMGGTSFRTEDIEVRQYGEAALVTGRTHLDFATE